MSSTPSASAFDLPTAVDPLARRIIAAFTDLALLLRNDGAIVQIVASAGFAGHDGVQALVGQRWVDTLAPEFRENVEALLQELHTGALFGAREVRLRVPGLGDVPFRFTAARLEDGRIGAFGVDLRDRLGLAQRLDGARQAMSTEYDRLRQLEAQYRVFFHVTSEGALFARGVPRSIVLDANPAAAVALGRPDDIPRDTTLQQLFEAGDRERLQSLMLAGAASSATQLRLRALGSASPELQANAHVFRQSGANVLLLRLWSLAVASLSERDAAVLRAFEAVPDAFVLTDGELHVLRANECFGRLIQHARPDAIVGEPLGRWLGVSNLGSMLARLREHGSLRAVESVVHDEQQKARAVEVTAVAVAGVGEMLSFGFLLRDVEVRRAVASTPEASGAQQLRDLVGRLPLKEIVRESSEVIEKLCLEVALQITGDNRAAAAQLLGISRQSLYNKLGQ